MKKCPKPLGYGIRRTPVVLGLVVVTVISMYFVKQTKLPEHILRMRHYFLPPKLIRHI